VASFYGDMVVPLDALAALEQALEAVRFSVQIQPGTAVYVANAVLQIGRAHV
jgi:hypothetical protein